MNLFDWMLVLVLSGAVLVGLWKGLARILAGAASIVVAFVVASRFAGQLVPYLRWTRAPDEALRFPAYLLLFAGVLVAGAVVGWIARRLLTAVALGWVDRLAGGGAAFLVALLAAAILLLPFVAWVPEGAATLESSRLAPYVAAVADLANLVAPDDLAHRWRDRIDVLRRTWRGGARHEVVVRMTGDGSARPADRDPSRS